MSTKAQHVQPLALNRTVINGIIGGVIGGIVFGMLMAMMGMLPMVGMLIGQDSAVVGFVVHMAISAAFGAAYGFAAPRLPLRSWVSAAVAGIGYGIILWVAGALILMPLMLGMNEMILQIGQMQLNSLMGHVIFGVVLAAINKTLLERG